MKIFPHFLYQMISMNHHITNTANEVLLDFLTGIASLRQLVSISIIKLCLTLFACFLVFHLAALSVGDI